MPPRPQPKTPQLDPALNHLLSLPTFEGKFDVTDFIGSLSEKLITQSNADPGPFDPKPFIENFEAAVDRLIAVRKDVQAKTEQMEKVVRVAEREYSKKMVDLNRGFESVGQSFSNMESKMNEVSGTAIRIGDQLESVHIERQRAQAAYDLIDYYNQFTRGDTTRLDALKKEGKLGRRQVAVILRRLNTVAREVDLPTADKTREAIDRYCEKFEKEMLYLFDRCYRRVEPTMMHHCAQTLLDFNGGASCVQIYVNQHDFFINSAGEITETQDPAVWNRLPDPNASPPTTEAGITNLFKEIRSTVDQEVRIVKAVFPNPAVVMQVFLQRVFAQSIQQYMEQLLNKGSSVSDLAYLRMLQLVHSRCTSLVEDLKVHELPVTSIRSAIIDEPSDLRSSLSTSAVALSGAPATSMSIMLETAMEELFVPYREGQRYLERESRSLGALYSSFLSNFARYHEKSVKEKSSVFDRMVTRLEVAAGGTTTTGASSTSAQAAAALMRFGGYGGGEKAQEKPTEDAVREEDGQLSVDVAEKVLKWHAEAVGRCVELSPPGDVARNTFSLLRVLTEAISGAYITTAIETAQSRLEVIDQRAEPTLQPLEVIKTSDLICHLWQQYVNVAIIPLTSSSVTIRREMLVFNNQTVSRLEGVANALLQRIADGVVSWLSAQLLKQKKNDFKPRNDDISFARDNTEPCELCCDQLEKVRDAAKLNLSGKNLESFLTEIGVSFHSLLLEHMRKFPVSATGGLMLAKDIKSYQDIINSFGVESLNERFEFIRQLGNVFLVQPGILKTYITENYLGRIDAALLRPYLAQRSDWGQFEKGFDEEPGSSRDSTGISAGGGTGLRDRFGRISVMMRDMEGMKLGENLNISLGLPTVSTSFVSSLVSSRV